MYFPLRSFFLPAAQILPFAVNTFQRSFFNGKKGNDFEKQPLPADAKSVAAVGTYKRFLGEFLALVYRKGDARDA